MKILLFALAAFLSFAPDLVARVQAGPKAEILWDKWGVPHIFAEDLSSLFYAFGRAQMHSHANVILRGYGEARGRAAEYWGSSAVNSDRLVHQLEIPVRAQVWLEAQKPLYRKAVESFTRGMNDYAAAHPERISKEAAVVLPVRPSDVMAYLQYIWHLRFVAAANPGLAVRWQDVPASNAWAVGRSRSASGNPMLLLNPHLSWDGYLRWYEAHLVGPGIDVYGANIVGMPFFIMGFNDQIGWADTVNTIDGADLYELKLTGDGYVWEGAARRFESRRISLKIRQGDGTFREEELVILKSVHGPVVARKPGKAIAIRIAGLDQPHMIEQMWDIQRAGNLAEFEQSLRRLQVPMLNFLYAGKDGHVMYVFGGRTPRRPSGDWSFWQGVVQGDTSATLWQETLPYESLPRVVDPPGGWLQNTNDPPWFCTFPNALDPGSYPPYLAPQVLSLRAQRSIRLLMEKDRISFKDFIAAKVSTRVELADRILGDLIAAVRRHGAKELQSSADLLESWDRQTDPGSRGAVLFDGWAHEMLKRHGSGMYLKPWNMADPLNTPRGLADPVAAVQVLSETAERIRQTYGSVDIPWGEVYRLKYGDTDLPARGGPGDLGVFSVLTFTPDGGNRYRPIHGEGFIALVEFGSTVTANVLVTYGNSTQPGSRHRGDQLELYLRKEFRPVWRTRSEIEANLEFKEAF